MLGAKAFDDSTARLLRVCGKPVPFVGLVVSHDKRTDGAGVRAARAYLELGWFTERSLISRFVVHSIMPRRVGKDHRIPSIQIDRCIAGADLGKPYYPCGISLLGLFPA